MPQSRVEDGQGFRARRLRLAKQHAKIGVRVVESESVCGAEQKTPQKQISLEQESRKAAFNPPLELCVMTQSGRTA
jgi:hypothetical protein